MRRVISSLLLPYAVKGGRIVSVDDVSSGLQKDCTCPVCGSALVAKKGVKVRHHFAHQRDANCANAPETVLHLAAKQVIQEERRLLIPEVVLGFEGAKPSWTLAAAQMVCVDEVRVETHLESDIPDLIVMARGRALAIEITVTHKTGEQKVDRLSKAGYSVLEIDLSEQSRFISLQELRELVVEGVEHKRWRYNRLAASVRRDVHQLSEQKPLIWRGLALHVDDCPLPARVWRGKPYANVIDDCYGCEHCVSSGVSDEESPAPLLCLARSGIQTYEQWRELRSRGRSF